MHWAYTGALGVSVETILGPSDAIDGINSKCIGPIQGHRAPTETVLGPNDELSRINSECVGPTLEYQGHQPRQC